MKTSSGMDINVQDVITRLNQFPEKVQKRVIKKSFRKTARQLLRAIKAAAPRSGTAKNGGKEPLYKNLKVSASRRYPIVWVGLKSQYYYKTLDLTSARGAPLSPWFKAAWDRQKRHVLKALNRQILLDITYEAGKNHARSKAKRF